MENGKNYLIVFDSQNQAFFLESLLKRKNFDVDYIQAPKYLAASCSASLKMDRYALKFACEMINTFNLKIYRVYNCSKEKGKMIYRVVKTRA